MMDKVDINMDKNILIKNIIKKFYTGKVYLNSFCLMYYTKICIDKFDKLKRLTNKFKLKDKQECRNCRIELDYNTYTLSILKTDKEKDLFMIWKTFSNETGSIKDNYVGHHLV